MISPQRVIGDRWQAGRPDSVLRRSGRAGLASTSASTSTMGTMGSLGSRIAIATPIAFAVGRFDGRQTEQVE